MKVRGIQSSYSICILSHLRMSEQATPSLLDTVEESYYIWIHVNYKVMKSEVRVIYHISYIMMSMRVGFQNKLILFMSENFRATVIKWMCLFSPTQNSQAKTIWQILRTQIFSLYFSWIFLSLFIINSKFINIQKRLHCGSKGLRSIWSVLINLCKFFIQGWKNMMCEFEENPAVAVLENFSNDGVPMDFSSPKYG